MHICHQTSGLVRATAKHRTATEIKVVGFNTERKAVEYLLEIGEGEDWYDRMKRRLERCK